MSPNAAGSARRPSTSTVYWNAWPAGAGGVPTWPPVTCWLCCWIAPITSLGVRPRALQRLRVEPHAHRILADAEHVDVADAGNARQFIHQVDGRVIAQEQAVVVGAWRGQRDDLQDRGGFLLHHHALRLHRRRQRRGGAGDPVLHQHLGEIQVGADVERHRQGIAAVARAGGLHVQHALHAVHLLLDRQGDGVHHGLGAGAGIARGDLHCRRHHVRILRHRQLRDARPGRATP